MKKQMKIESKGKKRIHIWLTIEQQDTLNDISKTTGLTRSFLLRDAITHWFSTRAAKMESFIKQTS